MFDNINNNNETRQQFLKDRKLELDKILKIKSSLLQELCKQEAQIIGLYPTTNNTGNHFNQICDIQPPGETTIPLHKLVSTPGLHEKNVNNNFKEDEFKRRLFLNDIPSKLDNDHYQQYQFIYTRCHDNIPPPPLPPVQDKLQKKNQSIIQLNKRTTTTPSCDDVNNIADTQPSRNNLHQSSRFLHKHLTATTSTNSADMKKGSVNQQDQEQLIMNDNNSIIIGNISPATFNYLPPLKNNNLNYFIKPAEVSSIMTIRNNSFYKKSDIQSLQQQQQQHPYKSTTHQCYHYLPNSTDEFNYSSNTSQTCPSVTDDLVNRHGGSGGGIEDNICQNKSSFNHQQHLSSSTSSLFVDDIEADYPQLNHATDQINQVIMNLSIPSENEASKTTPNYNNNNNNSSPTNLECIGQLEISSNTNSNSSIVDNLISQYGSNNFSIMTNGIINNETHSNVPTRRQLQMVNQNQQYGNGINHQYLPYHNNFGEQMINRVDGNSSNNLEGNSYQQRPNQEIQGLGGNWIITENDERIWCPTESRNLASLTKPQNKGASVVSAHQQQHQQQHYVPTFSSKLQPNMINFDSQKLNKSLLSPTNSSSSSICGGISSGDISGKKYKEKQWMETSLDGPATAIKCKYNSSSQPNQYLDVTLNSLSGSKAAAAAAAVSTTPIPTAGTTVKNSSILLAPPHSPSPPLAYPTISLKKKLSSHSMHQLSPRMVKQQLLGHQYNTYYQHSDYQLLLQKSSSDLIAPLDVQIPSLQSPKQLHLTNSFSNFSTVPFNSPRCKDVINSKTITAVTNNNVPPMTDANELTGKNMTIVQEAKFQPYTEVTKPFEMSDFYKYSIKFRQKVNSTNNNNILE